MKPFTTFAEDLANAKPYFGDQFPGTDGITCLKCGAVVNLSWVHIDWHEAQQ